MRRRKGAIALGAGLLAVGGLGAGCTILNSYGEVQPEKVEEGGPNNDGTVEGASNNDAMEAAADGTAPGDAADAGVEAGPRGVIVIGGAAVREGGEDLVLTALDPSTGSELLHAREKMVVSAVQYDGERDLWYIFESGGEGIFPLPTDTFYVHTRKLDPYTGVWTELSKAQIPPGLSFATTTASLKERVAYVAYGEWDAGALDAGVPAAYSLVTLNTTDPANVFVDSVFPLWGAPPVSVVGLRLQNGSVGGSALLASTVRVGTTSYTQLTPVDVSTNMPNARVPLVGTAPAGILNGYVPITDPKTTNVMYALTVTRSGAGTPPATVSVFDPLQSGLIDIGVFPFGDGNVKNPAFSSCEQLAFVVGTNSDLNVYAVSLAALESPDQLDSDGGEAGPPALTYTSAPTGHSGQGVYYEPYTKTVITPFSQSTNFALTAFSLGGSPTSPTLVQRQAPRWVPPPDVRPNFVGTAIPYPPNCAVFGDQ
jgi:hypothetical protein